MPFLRPFEWVATALKTFRERPLPSTYTTESRPTFDIFGTSRFPEYQVEVVDGGANNIEVVGSKVPTDRWRQYLSASISHDDATLRIVTFSRVLQDPTLGFPILVFDVSAPLASGILHAVRNLSMPPDGRIAAQVPALTLGAQLFLRTVFVDYLIGEPYGAIS